MDLIELYDAYREAPGWKHLRKEGIKLVPGRGAKRPAVMILGEAPGAEENLVGKPFVGRSGRLLNQLMGLAGLRAEPEYEDAPPGEQRQEVEPANTFITNVVKYRPPGNRTPTRDEIKQSVRWIRKEWIALGKPTVIVTVGATPLACIAPEHLPVSDSAGHVKQLKSGVSRPVVWPMFHPAYALRNPGLQPVVEEHWQDFGQWLREEGIT